MGLLEALGEERAVLVGHDWGASVAWAAARARPDRFPALAILSIPYGPRGPLTGPEATLRPTAMMRRVVGDGFHYQLYFQEPGVAEAERERDVRDTLRRTFYSFSGDVPPAHRWRPVHDDAAAGFLTGLPDPEVLPPWLTEADLDYYVGEYARTGFRGGLNWYRNADRNWELAAPYAGVTIQQPALFLYGERDPALDVPGFRANLERLAVNVPHLRGPVMIAHCGHRLQEERPDEVNAALLAFLCQGRRAQRALTGQGAW